MTKEYQYVRHTKIMKRADNICAHFLKIKYFKNKIFQKFFLLKVGLLVQKKIWKDSTNFQHWKMTLKIEILKWSKRLFIILVSPTVTLFSEKMLILTRCIHGFMPNLIKKSVMVIYYVVLEILLISTCFQVLHQGFWKVSRCSITMKLK